MMFHSSQMSSCTRKKEESGSVRQSLLIQDEGKHTPLKVRRISNERGLLMVDKNWEAVNQIVNQPAGSASKAHRDAIERALS